MKFQINYMYLFNMQYISHNLSKVATHVQQSSKNDVFYFDGWPLSIIMAK
jgi:hypothetical protein